VCLLLELGTWFSGRREREVRKKAWNWCEGYVCVWLMEFKIADRAIYILVLRGRLGRRRREGWGSVRARLGGPLAPAPRRDPNAGRLAWKY
jgi:hypothetical protein